MTNTVKLERTRINLSQQDLAEQVNVSRQTIHSIESGKFMPSYILAIKIARVLNMPVEELFVVEDND
ncbi:MAG: helix-turn-helix transcriptional regulator [Mucilaginibacter sp.]